MLASDDSTGEAMPESNIATFPIATCPMESQIKKITKCDIVEYEEIQEKGNKKSVSDVNLKLKLRDKKKKREPHATAVCNHSNFFICHYLTLCML